MSDSKMKSAYFTTISYALGPTQPIKIHYYRSTPSDQISESTGLKPLPILLLHGYPQTSYMWKEIVRRLSGDYELVVPDLRGYGKSSKPRGSKSHIEYSKREMAVDMVALMQDLGHSRFDIVSHDRGARVAHRLMLDYPEQVRRAMLIDIAPTLDMFERIDQGLGTGYWHWLFLIQPYPLPENVILASGEAYWKATTSTARGENFEWDSAAERLYMKAYLREDAIHAACEDYRAAASIDLNHDRASRTAHQKIDIDQLRIIWGGRGRLQSTYGDHGLVDIWKQYSMPAVGVTGQSLDAGHYVPEEQPELLVEDIRKFLA